MLSVWEEVCLRMLYSPRGRLWQALLPAYPMCILFIFLWLVLLWFGMGSGSVSSLKLNFLDSLATKSFHMTQFWTMNPERKSARESFVFLMRAFLLSFCYLLLPLNAWNVIVVLWGIGTILWPWWQRIHIKDSRVERGKETRTLWYHEATATALSCPPPDFFHLLKDNPLFH